MSVVASGGITAGLVGFLVVIALVVAAVFLFRSMVRHLRKVPPTFEPPPTVEPPHDQPRAEADDASRRPPAADA